MAFMKLNPSQQRAVEHMQGPLLVLAGAGSGKTRVITHRIAHLVERGGVRPESILAVSFTNKAAREMGERMVPLIGSGRARKLALSTFHSFGVRMLQEERRALGFGERFVIFDQGDSVGLVREILRGMRRSGGARKLDAMAILARISKWKNDLLAPDEVPDSDFEYDAVAKEIYPEYEARLNAMCAVDFDGLVATPVRLLRDDEALRRKWQQRFRHMLIDEFQDTSRMQLQLVQLLVNELGNICVVGDDDQSIYAWRGADVGNILDFETHFPGTTVVKLEDNYRSLSPILNVANAVIAQSPLRRHGKTLRAARGDGDRVRMVVAEDPEQEAKTVALEIDELRKQGAALSDVGVLYRSNLQSRLVEQELRMLSLPARMLGGTQFFDRKEVKDAAAYLRTVVNPRDEISLRRVLNYPARGIGTTTVQRIERYALAHGISFIEALRRVDAIEGIPDNARRSARRLMGLLDEARRRFASQGSLASAARTLFEQVGLRDDLMDAADGGKAGGVRHANVEHLIGLIDRYEQRAAPGEASLAGFLARITLQGDSGQQDEGEKVALSTLHAAKGLEFRYVFLIGCVEGQLPHSRTTDPKVTDASPSDVEEERRLFYVGVTRARDRLYISRPKRRRLRGNTVPLTPSRFLDELPEDQVQEYEREVSDTLDVDEIAEMGRAFLERMKAAQTS